MVRLVDVSAAARLVSPCVRLSISLSIVYMPLSPLFLPSLLLFFLSLSYHYPISLVLFFSFSHFFCSLLCVYPLQLFYLFSRYLSSLLLSSSLLSSLVIHLSFFPCRRAQAGHAWHHPPGL